MSTFYRKTARRVASLSLLLSDLALHAVIYWRKICRAWHQKTCMVRDVGDTAKKRMTKSLRIRIERSQNSRSFLRTKCTPLSLNFRPK